MAPNIISPATPKVTDSNVSSNLAKLHRRQCAAAFPMIRSERLVGRFNGPDLIADALQRLRGEAGTSVGVSVQRPKTGESVDVLIERATIVR